MYFPIDRVHPFHAERPAMHVRTLKSDFLLLLTSIIWGFAFVAQSLGMDHVGPFTFVATRFFLGAVVLLPLILHRRKINAESKVSVGKTARFGLVLGSLLFMGSSLQQLGLLTTTAGKAGFITGLYVVFVPLLGLFRSQRAQLWTVGDSFDSDRSRSVST